MNSENEQNFIRDKILELLSRGKTQRQIASEMKISLGKTNQLIQSLKSEAKSNVQKYINEELPATFEFTINGLNQIIEQTWTSIENAKNEHDKRAGRLLLMQVYPLRLDVMSSASSLDRAVGLVDSLLEERQKNKKKENDNEVTTKPR